MATTTFVSWFCLNYEWQVSRHYHDFPWEKFYLSFHDFVWIIIDEFSDISMIFLEEILIRIYLNYLWKVSPHFHDFHWENFHLNFHVFVWIIIDKFSDISVIFCRIFFLNFHKFIWIISDKFPDISIGCSWGNFCFIFYNFVWIIINKFTDISMKLLFSLKIYSSGFSWLCLIYQWQVFLHFHDFPWENFYLSFHNLVWIIIDKFLDISMVVFEEVFVWVFIFLFHLSETFLLTFPWLILRKFLTDFFSESSLTGFPTFPWFS